MGHLFSEAGYEVVFVESSCEIVRLLNERGNYPLRLLDAHKQEVVETIIERIEAILPEDEERMVNLMGEADLIGTAVGINNYPAIAPLIARGIRQRFDARKGPLDIYLCENDLAAQTTLRKAVESRLDDPVVSWMEKKIGFVRVSVARMVPGKSENDLDPLLVVADAYREFPYDESARRAPLPTLSTLKPIADFEAEFQRKIYTYNLGHAVLAYAGYLRHYTFVHEGFSDEWVNTIFNGALQETAMALFRRYPQVLNAEEHAHVLHDVRTRFGNPLLQDPIFRVARDPLRKLGPRDRLIGSALLCLEEGVFPENIATVCAAALLYDHPDDPSAQRLQAIMKNETIENALSQVTTVDASTPLGRKIIEEYRKLTTCRKEEHDESSRFQRT